MALPSSSITGSLLELINSYETAIDNDMSLNYGGGAIYESVLTGTAITGSTVIGELRRRYMTSGDDKRYRWTSVQVITVDGNTNILMRNDRFPFVRK